MADLESIIETAWEGRDKISAKTKGPVRKAVDQVLLLLDQGKVRVAEKKDGQWVVNQWLKKAVLLSFRLNDMVGSRLILRGALTKDILNFINKRLGSCERRSLAIGTDPLGNRFN